MTEGLSGNESLINQQYPFPEVSKIDAAYTAVYSTAHALQDMITSGQQDGKSTDSQDFQPWQVRETCLQSVTPGWLGKRTLSLTKL